MGLELSNFSCPCSTATALGQNSKSSLFPDCLTTSSTLVTLGPASVPGLGLPSILSMTRRNIFKALRRQGQELIQMVR
ncbi:C-Type Lectin Domain Family 14 Member A [Manis pentadactyla]|nr:C-Type Lectin Domain Family 14 Member A [Manis pentadactyla]